MIRALKDISVKRAIKELFRRIEGDTSIESREWHKKREERRRNPIKEHDEDKERMFQ